MKEFSLTHSEPAPDYKSRSHELSDPLQTEALEGIAELDQRLVKRFAKRCEVKRSLTRQLVSFQANKGRPAYRWYKYKEAFSAALVESLLADSRIETGKLLDPFAGAGTSLFAADGAGMAAEGIELLPIGQEIIKARQCIESDFTSSDYAVLKTWTEEAPWERERTTQPLPTLQITEGAYPAQTLKLIEQYLAAIGHESERVQTILRFAVLCILESISYTRKDGQYLRWDKRSGRRQGQKPFDKGPILEFTPAIRAKLNEILNDLESGDIPLQLFPQTASKRGVRLFDGSCLEVLPNLPPATYDAIVTSPPYCNRYDYTRTYALELALLGIDKKEMVGLRQAMVSCTVENRAKDLLKLNPAWDKAIAAVDSQETLQAILKYLDDQNDAGNLNNTGIPRMARGYFYEMGCVIFECLRVMKHRSTMFMVNDNVRYAGASISVDLILSDIAEKIGFNIHKILVLPTGKGNSSQQMGEHGRERMRKCVYVWTKS